jgi:NAD(P)-dependent dehydrogenase (short-subunit alcohol dehydrogenase family)
MSETGRTVVIAGAGSGVGVSAVRALGTMRDANGLTAGKRAEPPAYSPAFPDTSPHS